MRVRWSEVVALLLSHDMMAQHVGHSWSPVVVLVILSVFQLANAYVLTRVTTSSNLTINSVHLTNRQTLPASELSVSKFGILVKLEGKSLYNDLELSWSAKEQDCESGNGLRKVWTADDGQCAVYEFQDDRIFEVNVVYFCTKTVAPEMEAAVKWINLGKDFAVNPKVNG